MRPALLRTAGMTLALVIGLSFSAAAQGTSFSYTYDSWETSVEVPAPYTAQQPLDGLRTALKKISRSVNAAFSAVPVAKFEQQTAAAAVSANKAAKAQAKLASGTTKAAKAAKRSVAEFDELDRLQASLAESAGAAAASTTRKSSSAATIKAADAEPPQLSPPALLNQQLQNFWATLQAVLAPAAALWDAAWQQMKTAALTVWQDLLGGVQLTWAEYGQPIAQSAALALENHPVAERFAADPY